MIRANWNDELREINNLLPLEYWPKCVFEDLVPTRSYPTEMDRSKLLMMSELICIHCEEGTIMIRVFTNGKK